MNKEFITIDGISIDSSLRESVPDMKVDIRVSEMERIVDDSKIGKGGGWFIAMKSGAYHCISKKTYDRIRKELDLE